jgi:hypothetical protein
MPTTEQERGWMAQWRSAERDLSELHRRDLAALTDDEALRASEALLALAAFISVPPERLRTSGLVDQQAFFQRLRKKLGQENNRKV